MERTQTHHRLGQQADPARGYQGGPRRRRHARHGAGEHVPADLALPPRTKAHPGHCAGVPGRFVPSASANRDADALPDPGRRGASAEQSAFMGVPDPRREQTVHRLPRRPGPGDSEQLPLGSQAPAHRARHARGAA